MKLYGYYRSSAAYRTRIALNLKGLAYEDEFIHLAKGKQGDPSYIALNPQGLVPSLEDEAGIHTQSLAIIEYLEEQFPQPPLLPDGALARARVRSLALSIACEIHPLNNLKVLKYLGEDLHASDGQKQDWYQHWINEGFTALEKRLCNDSATGIYCHGDLPSLADICLVPQLYNARRFNCDLASFPTIVAIEQACLELPAFHDAGPEQQADME